MKKLVRMMVLAAVAAVLVPGVAGAEDLMTFKDAAKRILGDAPKKTKMDVTPTAEQAAKLKGMGVTDKSFSFLVGKDDAGKIVSGGIVLPEKGHEGPMKVAVAFSADGTIKDVFFVTWNDERGAPVKEASYMAQYKGKGPKNNFKVGGDVDGVSNATGSANALANAVKRAVKGWQVLVVEAGAK